jgi:molybdenum cofactor biosynthesis protein B
MGVVQAVPVHIAVLAVGKDAEPTQAVAERAAGAGHKVVARATVLDAQNAVRAQVSAWMDDPNIDVIVISGSAESTAASAAVKPLATEMLPGFTDLFRYLAFQEIGASAMLSNAEAARCGSTFVFVLPASANAVRAAMDKLILPQLDVNTTPQNLVSQMPRIQDLTDAAAIPKPIEKEKTAGGSGLNARMPGLATPPRGKPITANVITRGSSRSSDQTKADPPTKPIDVAKLEQQIALSESGSSPTKRVDLSRLPKVPPGADETLDDDAEAKSARPNGRHARLDSEPIAPPAPASRQVQHTPTRGSGVVKPPPETRPTTSAREVEQAASRSAGVAISKPGASGATRTPSSPPPLAAREIQHTPSKGVGVVAPPSAPSTRKPPTVIPPIPKRPVTEPVAVVPPVKPSQPVLTRPSQPSTPPALSRPSQPSTPPPAKPDAPPPEAAAAQPAQSRPAKKPTDPPPVPAAAARPRPPSGPVSRPKVPSGPVPTVAATPSGRSRPDTDSAPLSTPTQAIPIVSVPEGVELTPMSFESAPHRAPTDSTGIAAVTAPAVPTLPAVTDAVRLPPPRKDTPPDFAALVAPSMSRATGDLPLGEFNYPIKKGIRWGWILALLATGAIGFAAVVFIVPMIQKSSTSASTATPPPIGSAPAQLPPEPPVVAVATIDAAVAEPAPVPVPEGPLTGDAVDPVPPTPTSGRRPQTSTTATRPDRDTNKQPATTTNTTTTATRPAGAGSGSQADEPEQEPPTAPPIADSDCDEVACVLAKYNRPCCEKYRPKESDIKPRAAGGVPTELDKAAVRSAIEKVKPAVVACGEKNSDKGTVKIAIKVKPDGSVSDASVAAAPNDALGACVASALKKAQFAKTVNGGSFTYPFVF